MTPEAKRKLQEVVYHRVMMWDAAREAELLLERDVTTIGDDLDTLACACNKPDDAFDIKSEDLKSLIEKASAP